MAAVAYRKMQHLVLETHNYYGLARDEAVAITTNVATSIGRWREVAARMGLKSHEIDRLASAFEHGDVERAMSQRRVARRIARHLRQTKRPRSVANARRPNGFMRYLNNVHSFADKYYCASNPVAAASCAWRNLFGLAGSRCTVEWLRELHGACVRDDRAPET